MIQHVMTPDQKIVELQADPGLRISCRAHNHFRWSGEVKSPIPQMDRNGAVIIESRWQNMIDEQIPD